MLSISSSSKFQYDTFSPRINKLITQLRQFLIASCPLTFPEIHRCQKAVMNCALSTRRHRAMICYYSNRHYCTECRCSWSWYQFLILKRTSTL